MPNTTSRSPIKHNGYTRWCGTGRGKKVCHYFFVLFYCTDVCYRPLGSVNSSMQVPEFTFPFLADHLPQFCKFKHTSARIGKTGCFHSWPTTHHLSSANSSTQMLELAKLSVPALGRPSTHLNFCSWLTPSPPCSWPTPTLVLQTSLSTLV